MLGTLCGWAEERSLHFSASQDSLEVHTILMWLCYGIAFLGGGASTVSHAWHSVRELRLNIDVLMLLAAVGTACLGEFAEGAVLLFLFSLSHALEGYILGRSRNAIRGLMELTPDEVIVVRDNAEAVTPIHDVQVGDSILVRPSERIPLDGVVVTGQSSVNEAPVTGESLPVDKAAGAQVLAGSLNLDGVLKVKVQRAVHDTTLSRMIKLVEEAQASEASSQRFTQWFDTRYPTLVLIAAGLTFLSAWWYVGSGVRAFYMAMTFLVVASPCAVVISIPSAILSAIASAARSGVLFKGGIYLETLAKVTAIAFDKTGTLTSGKPQIVSELPVTGVESADLLASATSLERESEHPIARAFVTKATAAGLDIPPSDGVQVVLAQGIKGNVGGAVVRVGKVPWLSREVAVPPVELSARMVELQQSGQTIVGVTRGERWLGIFGVADTIRETSQAAVQQLRRLGISQQVMLTGDHPASAAAIASGLQLDFQAQLLPEHKLAQLRQWKQAGEVTAMVGDGMNDAPALAVADVGISLGGAGTDVALETADIVVMADDLRRLPYAIRLARQTQSIVRQNLVISFGTMLGLLVTSLFVTLPLPLAVLGHEGSTVLVILNGLRLLSVRFAASPFALRKEP